MTIKYLSARAALFMTVALSPLISSAQTVNILYTTDVHGALFNYDFVRDTVSDYSLANAYTYITQVRDTSDNVLLLDNGDYLQGTPVVYYYNNVDTAAVNVMARVFNYMKYDAIGIGNHDIEARHRVYDKFATQVNAPILAANVRNVKTGEPYFKPYAVFNKGGKRIAVIGLTTPYVPHWLPESFWSGMEFEDMVESAAHWVKVVREKENPDAIIGLFHAGYDYNYGNQSADSYKNENASVLVAERVDGFDAILIGHDHKLYNQEATSPSGRRVPILDVGTAARNIGHVSIEFKSDGSKSCTSRIIALANTKPSADYDNTFKPQQYAVKAYARKVITNLVNDVYAVDALAGSSAFVDVVHRTMLKHTGADISMSAPLQINTFLPHGDINVGRMFALYKYENMLTVLNLTGREVVDYLEYSYDMWIQDPTKAGHVLLLSRPGRMKNNYYSLDSAAGIIYTVDVTKKKGHRVNVISMADGSKFDKSKTYKVALNSYRANGGGGHLEFGSGIPFAEISKRIISTIDTDLRGLVIADLEEEASKTTDGKVYLKPLGQWKFVPEDVVNTYLPADIKNFR